jgi:4-hydroxybenzoate polyprenyltransferase
LNSITDCQDYLNFLVHNKILIALAAVALAIQTEIELGLSPAFQPFLLIIFFATIFEYNLQPAIFVITNATNQDDKKQQRKKLTAQMVFFLLIPALIVIVTFFFFINKNSQWVLLMLGLFTLAYSIPLIQIKKKFYSLRDIPFLKIFLIAFVWSTSTVVLPALQTNLTLRSADLLLIFIQRFLFVFVITMPFDIRDLDKDKLSGIKTIPMLLGIKKATNLSVLCLIIFIVLCIAQYSDKKKFVLAAMIISAFSTYLFMKLEKVKKSRYYHDFVLDGSLLLQAILVVLFYCISLLG